jgi:hypothetical protein
MEQLLQVSLQLRYCRHYRLDRHFLVHDDPRISQDLSRI